MAPAVKDLVIEVDTGDPSRQRLVADGQTPGDDGICPEALRIGAEGLWRPDRFNKVIRFARYRPKGCFRKHMDAVYVNHDTIYIWTDSGAANFAAYGLGEAPVSSTKLTRGQKAALQGIGVSVKDLLEQRDLRRAHERTLYSCLVYLNDFSGGATNFMSIPGRFSEFQKISTPANRAVQPGDAEFLKAVNPGKGSACLFFQPGLVHDGVDLVEGQKYFLRTDLVFRQVA